MHMISSLNMSAPGESDLFANNNNSMLYGRVDSNISSVASIGFDDFVSDDIIRPNSVGRESGSGSPSSLGVIDEQGPANNNSGNNNSGGISPVGLNNLSPEDVTKSFPIVLHSIVSDERSDIAIHWLPCGTRFVIANKEEFSKNILPHYFGGRSGGAANAGATTKFTSFTRRLKRWNFSRVPSGREMGAYFHEDFRRGEPELAKKIMYPVTKSSPAGSGGGGGGGGKASGSGGKEKKAVKAKPTVPKISKARRRASTGSIVPMSNFDDAILDISPAPINNRGPPQGTEDILPLPLLESDANDIKEWLTSADFEAMADGLVADPTPSATPSTTGGMGAPLFDLEPPCSVVSSNSSQQQAFLLPPPSFPNTVISGVSPQQQGLHMLSPRTMRRHSVTLGNLTRGINMPPMMIGSNSGINTNFGSGGGMTNSNSFTRTNSNSFTSSGGAPLAAPPLASNFCGLAMPSAVLSASTGASNNVNMNTMMNFGSTSSSLPMQMMTVKTKTGMEPAMMPMQTQNASNPLQPDHTDSMGGGGGGGGAALTNDDNRSISSFSREFSFDDLKMIDPFT